MAGVSVKWHGEKLKAETEAEFIRRLHVASITLKNEIKEQISAPSPPPSAGGEYPHKDTGRLRASISNEVDNAAKTARVGTNVLYGKFLELGTKKMAARPFLRPTFDKLKAQIMEIMKGKQ